MKSRLVTLLIMLCCLHVSMSCKQQKKSQRSRAKTSAHSTGNDREADAWKARYAAELGVSAASLQNEKLYLFIDDWKGVPYKYGGTSQSGTDCSGFVGNLYREVYGKSVPRSTVELAKSGKKVNRSELREGDLVFFNISGKKNSHVGVYLQNDRFVHASTSRGVVISDLNSSYYKDAFSQGVRV